MDGNTFEQGFIYLLNVNVAPSFLRLLVKICSGGWGDGVRAGVQCSLLIRGSQPTKGMRGACWGKRHGLSLFRSWTSLFHTLLYLYCGHCLCPATADLSFDSHTAEITYKGNSRSPYLPTRSSERHSEVHILLCSLAFSSMAGKRTLLLMAVPF